MLRNKEQIDEMKGQVISRYPELKEETNLFVCDAIINDVIDGKLDYKSNVFKDLSSQKKYEVIQLANQYSNLCFYDGDRDNWLDSVQRGYSSDEDLALTKILDNYDFLCELARDGGEDTLELCSKMSDNKHFCDYAVIDILRSNFAYDEVLKKVLFDMSEENSVYNVFDDEQKADLLTHPLGTLYFYGEDSIKIQSPLFLSIEIYNRINDNNTVDFDNYTDDNQYKMIMEMKGLLTKSDNFSDTVLKMSQDYDNYIHKITGEKVDYVNSHMGLDSENSDYIWQTGNTGLAQMFDNPYNPDRTKNNQLSEMLNNSKDVIVDEKPDKRK